MIIPGRGVFLNLNRVKYIYLNRLVWTGGGVLNMFICKYLILLYLLVCVWYLGFYLGCIRERLKALKNIYDGTFQIPSRTGRALDITSTARGFFIWGRNE